MTSKLFANLLLFSLFGISMCFFGNLYEAIVIVPNILSDSVQQIHYFQNFFKVTNPIFFYIPLSPLAIITLMGLYFKTSTQNVQLKRLLKFASLFLIAAVILSVYIITQINLKLFFGDLNKYANEIPSMALLWNILNIARVLLVGIALIFIFRAQLQTQKDQ